MCEYSHSMANGHFFPVMLSLFIVRFIFFQHSHVCLARFLLACLFSLNNSMFTGSGKGGRNDFNFLRLSHLE